MVQPSHRNPQCGLALYVILLGSLAFLLNERTILVIENTRPTADGSLKRRYNAEDIRPYLPPNWHCRQEPFWLLITYGAKSPV